MCLKCVAITLKEDSYGQENLSRKTITTEKKHDTSYLILHKVKSLTKIGVLWYCNLFTSKVVAIYFQRFLQISNIFLPAMNI